MTVTTSPVQQALSDYRRKYAAHQWAAVTHGGLTEAAEKTSDHREADRYRDEIYDPATAAAFDAAVTLLDLLDGLKDDLTAAIGDAWAYRCGEAAGDDDADIDPHDREQAQRHAALADHLGLSIS